jgi:hypothetical protein
MTRTSQPSKYIQTASGRIAYVEQGVGPVALFVHGVLRTAISGAIS